jgi:hypothetical protein
VQKLGAGGVVVPLTRNLGTEQLLSYSGFVLRISRNLPYRDQRLSRILSRSVRLHRAAFCASAAPKQRVRKRPEEEYQRHELGDCLNYENGNGRRTLSQQEIADEEDKRQAEQE